MENMAEIIQKLNGYEARFEALEKKDEDTEETVKTYAATAAQAYLRDNPVEEAQKEDIIKSLKEEVKTDINAGNWPTLKAAEGITLKNRFNILLDEKLEERDKSNNETRDEEKRKNNLVVYGVKEAEEEDREGKIKHDKDEIIRISNRLGLQDFTEYNIMRIFRMGTYDAANTRPILVELDSAVTKYKIMRNTYKLKDIEEFQGWSLQHDMTKQQRENVRNLVEEAKQKEANDETGEYIYRVRGPPHKKYIKKIKKEN